MKIEFCLRDRNDKIVKQTNQGDRSYLALHHNFALGDYFEIKVNHAPCFLMAQLNPALQPSLLYLSKRIWRYEIPFHLQRESAYPPGAFTHRFNYAWVRYATEDEIEAYQNLAFNSHDQHDPSDAFPHASANIETGNYEVFFARNVIDGVIANEYHGHYPFESWGTGERADAAIKINFGRPVLLNKIGLILRGDYPHDSYWKSGVISFSDHSLLNICLKKTLEEQFVSFSAKKVSWLKLSHLAHSKEKGFCALTQLEAYGRNFD